MGGSITPGAGTAETLLLFSLRMISGRRGEASVGGFGAGEQHPCGGFKSLPLAMTLPWGITEQLMSARADFSGADICACFSEGLLKLKPPGDH